MIFREIITASSREKAPSVWDGCGAAVRFAVVKPGEKALDLGTGTGIIPILLEAKTEGRHFTGLEIQEESADMARRSVKYNHLEEKVEIVTGDIKEAGSRFALASFDVVTSNPPYMNDAHGIKTREMPRPLPAMRCFAP